MIATYLGAITSTHVYTYVNTRNKCIIVDNLAMYTFTRLSAYNHHSRHTGVFMFVYTYNMHGLFSCILYSCTFTRACV